MNVPTYLGIKFSFAWQMHTIHGHITLINGRCGDFTKTKDRLRFEKMVKELFEMDIHFGDVPSKPLVPDVEARRSRHRINMLMRC